MEDKKINYTFSEGWEKIHAKQNWGGYPAEEVIRFIARNYYRVENRKKIRVLDFGCGAGSNTWYLAREGFDVYAFDGSQSAVRKVQERLFKEGLTAEVKVSDAGNLEYENDFFDCIIDSRCIQNNKLKDIVIMYRECYRMIKPGGKIFSTGFSTFTTGYGTGEELEDNTYKNVSTGPLRHDCGTINHFWGENELRTIIEKSGFKNINVDRISRTDRNFLIDLLIVDGEKI